MRYVDRLCFGTSTFVAGKLRPDKDSRPGITALAAALDAGVQSIHSNPNLGTQWAIREAIDAAASPADVRHLIKVELPADIDAAAAAELVADAVRRSRAALDTALIYAVVVEVDLKRTGDRRRLADVAAITGFYRMASDVARRAGVCRVYGFCHSPAHLAACLRVDTLDGYAAQYNQVEAWPALYLDRIAGTDRHFLGMAPLRRGGLVDPGAPDPTDRLRALRWALGHPGVSQVAITISSPQHLTDVLTAAAAPLPPAVVHSHARTWQARATRAPLSLSDHPLTTMNTLRQHVQGDRQ